MCRHATRWTAVGGPTADLRGDMGRSRPTVNRKRSLMNDSGAYAHTPATTDVAKRKRNANYLETTITREVEMTPLEMLTNTFRSALRDGAVTPEGLENLRQLALHVIDHDTTSAEETRSALREALDTSNRPNARSFLTDSGIGRSRA